MNKNKVVLGIDVGGTRIRVGVVTDNGELLKVITEKTPRDKKEILSKINEMVKSVIFREVCAIGIGIAGPIDKKSGKIYPPNIKSLTGVNIFKEFKKYNIPVSIENDSNCFAIAEHKFGTGVGKKNILGITIGTGIGCGIIIDDKLYLGKDGAAGEVGHIIINSDAKGVGRGVKGSFENLASGTAISRRAKESGLEETSLENLIKIMNKNKKAKTVISETGGYMGVGLASLINIFNPEIIVLGGSVGNCLKYFRKEVNREINSRGIMPSKKVKIVTSKLRYPGVLGAGIIALER